MNPPLVASRARTSSSSATEAFVVVRVGGYCAAWPVHDVREVRLPVPLVRDPALPAFADGALLLRRALVPVVDLRHRWSVAPSAEVGDRIVLTRVAPFVIGFVVDEVLAVVRAPARVPSPAVALPPRLERHVVRAVITLTRVDRTPAGEAFVVTPAEVLDESERAALGTPSRS